jgi:RNA polymerase sigma factor (sigma-70 family)
MSMSSKDGRVQSTDPMDCRSRLIVDMKRRFRLSRSVAEDAVDEAIAKVLRIELKTGNIFPLLFQITKNILLDRQKRMEVARRNLKILRNSAVRPPGPLQDLMTQELESSLKQELVSLRERDRKAFELFYIEGLSHRQVSLEIGVTMSYCKAIVFRVRRVLRGRLERFAS